jgi:hypothetical protein
VAALSIDYTLADGTFTVTDAAAVVHDLTAVLAPAADSPLSLLYLPGQPPQAVVRCGLATAQFVIHLAGGQTLTLDPRTATALARLGWTIPHP